MWVSLLSIPLGVAAFAGLMTFADNPPVMQACEAKVPEVTGVFGADFFLCIIVPFFQDLLRNNVGYFVGLNVLAAAVALVFFFLIEGGRQGARFFVKFPVILSLLGQLLGIGVVFPLFFIPSFEFGENRSKRVAFRPVSSLRAHVAVALLIPFVLFVIFMVSLSQHVDSKLFFSLAVVFQVLPLLFLPVALFRPASAKAPATYSPSSAYFSTAKFGYGICAGLGLGLYYFSICQFLLEHSLIPLEGISSLPALEEFIFQQVPQKLGQINFLENGAALGLGADVMGMSLGTAILALREFGFFYLLKFLVSMVLFSPGFAMAQYYYDRESKLEIRAASPVSKETKKVEEVKEVKEVKKDLKKETKKSK